jgi:hypothetical protein
VRHRPLLGVDDQIVHRLDQRPRVRHVVVVEVAQIDDLGAGAMLSHVSDITRILLVAGVARRRSWPGRCSRPALVRLGVTSAVLKAARSKTVTDGCEVFVPPQGSYIRAGLIQPSEAQLGALRRVVCRLLHPMEDDSPRR